MTIGFGFSSVFALPLAISVIADDNWRETCVALHFGPFIVDVTWRWS